ncbi:hypothetical protein V8G54_010870 [Vigna mungo]|uniref:Copia protein n=1 Tax=Vigna mungo TaxID=3915 RepID=A0AAQ3P0Y4_VIGMU
MQIGPQVWTIENPWQVNVSSLVKHLFPGPQGSKRALADLASEIAWTRSLLYELRLPLLRKPTLWCDNMSARVLASNPVMHARSKHIDIDVHCIRDQLLQNEIFVAYVPSADQIADCLTKALTHTRFNQLKDKLGVTLSPISLKGGVRDKIP